MIRVMALTRLERLEDRREKMITKLKKLDARVVREGGKSIVN